MTDGWLSTWQEIGDYIGRSIKTAKKYYKRYGLPVHRAPGGLVSALKPEIDLWLIKFDKKKKERKK